MLRAPALGGGKGLSRVGASAALLRRRWLGQRDAATATFAPEKVALVACDLDGTLCLPDNTVGPRTQAALRAARAQGVTVVLATVRSAAAAAVA
jgi:hypothetical protein